MTHPIVVSELAARTAYLEFWGIVTWVQNAIQAGTGAVVMAPDWSVGMVKVAPNVYAWGLLGRVPGPQDQTFGSARDAAAAFVRTVGVQEAAAAYERYLRDLGKL